MLGAAGLLALGAALAWWTTRAAIVIGAPPPGGGPAAATASPSTGPSAPAAPAAAAPDENDMLISKMRIQDIKGCTYFYSATETTIPQLQTVIPTTMQALEAATKEHQIEITAAPLLVYQGVTQDMGKPFKLEMGFPVKEGTKEVGDFKVREVATFHCATVIYSGPIMRVGEAYQQLFMELMQAGMQPTGETREMYLYWEAPESPNNIELIMAGVK
jgi:effector-binding domain-containing protein